MSKTVVSQLDSNRFKHWSPEARPQLPPGYRAPLDMRTSRELIAERIKKFVEAGKS